MDKMTRQEVASFFREVSKKHLKTFWMLNFNNSHRSGGSCNYERQVVFISSFFIDHLSSETIKKIVLHEVAHAIDKERGGTLGHGTSWVKICQELGIEPKRIITISPEETESVHNGKRWKLTCPKCGRVTYQQRYSYQNGLACGYCCREFNGGKYTKEFDLIAERNTLEKKEAVMNV